MLTAMMLLSNISYASKDINGHWASETMARWQSQGLIKGDEKGNLNPDKSITRAEFITIVNKVMAYNKTGDKIKNYKDLKQNDWYYSQIMTALEQGYINGTSNDTMSPNKDITRQEVMVIINNIAGLKQSKFDLSAVKDQDKIASWAKNAATNMIANGYITGYQGKINPNKAMKRAEAITLLDAYKQNNRTISFQGQYSLGKANKVTLLTGNIQINDSQIKELITLGELTKRAWKRNVQIIIEGPGHMAIDEIEANVKLEKKLCHNAPFYVLGPLVTDIAPGYDHITSAIGGAIAAAAGVDFLCYVTPAEHLRLPNLDDMKEGIIASRIAAHAADISKKVPKAIDWDNRMAKYRADIDWEGMFSEAIDEEKARRYRKESTPENEDTCTMCGKMCSMRTMKKVMSGEDVNILK